tara:strand:- start:3255 stop:4184 length:930 start_codon:yes stop_codon:yes gene_type:complete
MGKIIITESQLHKIVGVINEAKKKKKKKDTTLCARGKAAAKAKYDVYPSAYANGYAVQVCKGTKPGLDGKKRCSGKYCSGKKNEEFTPNPTINEDLAVWFGDKKKKKGSKQPQGPWVNICKKKSGGGHPECGRDDADKKGYPVCRAKSVAANMSQSEKDSACRRKREKEKKDPQTGKGQKPTNIKIKNYKKKKKNEASENFAKLVKEHYQNINEWGEIIQEAEYQGRKVKLNKPTRGDVKKFKVYVKNDKGNVVKVNFGHGGTSAKKKGEKTMRIKKSNPERRKAFRARHNCDNPGPKWKARYWSCKAW